jgi:hypothetical protein
VIEQSPLFFVPGKAADEQEQVFQHLANFAGRPVPAQRIFSIRFMHDSVEWTATVGEKLRGKRTIVKRGREYVQSHGDEATVMAIFPNDPYIVVTSRIPVGPDLSLWENPFMAGIPLSVLYFTK